MATHLPSQKYLSTRGGSYGLSFEEVVLKGLASDGGLFIPEQIPSLPENWFQAWKSLSFQELAFEVLSLYISPSEIPHSDLKELITRSYSTFRHPKVTPLRPLLPDEHLHLLELFHGPTFAFKDVALQFVGNLFEYFLVRKNKAAVEGQRHHLTVVGATSGDTGSAAIYGLRGKKDVSVFILHPKGRVSPIQEAQMTTVLDKNVHNVAVEGTFDDCQDIVKTLFSDPEFNKAHNLGAVNSINWARILAQIVYYFHSYFAIVPSNLTSPDPSFKLQYIVPTGNFGDILAGYFAKRMGLPIAKLHISTNPNDILDRFVKSGVYEKHFVTGKAAEGGLIEDGVKADPAGVKETLSPAMDILVSSNFERLLWYLALETETAGGKDQAAAGAVVKDWMESLKATGRIAVSDATLAACRRDFGSQRVSDETTVVTIKSVFTNPATGRYILDPHSAVGVAGALRVIAARKAETGGKLQDNEHFISLSTAHPAKFSHAVDLALGKVEGYGFEELVRPKEFIGLEQRERRCRDVERAEAELVKRVIVEELEAEKRA
ncbi:tryptophan synthase beta subunit-like PLP-dependent enzyme [Kalaharituber pfeilii]|nr:tryptophan synthase beta subunit-like PLP-dependent enzyme [Kalaharituber pfeilii]